MTKKFEYRTVLIKGVQNGIYAEFPFDAFTTFGTRRAVPVKVSFDGEVYQLSLLPRGEGKHWIYVRKEIREKIGKNEGDEVQITVEKDEAPKVVKKIPDYVEWLLDNEPEMKKAFESLSNFYKKYWIQFIEETKNEETKVERINKLFEFLRERN